jgi:hypothetical protein
VDVFEVEMHRLSLNEDLVALRVDLRALTADFVLSLPLQPFQRSCLACAGRASEPLNLLANVVRSRGCR